MNRTESRTEGALYPNCAERWLQQLREVGWLYVSEFRLPDDGGEMMLDFARRLGPLYLGRGMTSTRPIMDTCPSARAGYDVPFNQLPGLGWHNDFSTHRVRPRWSLSYIRREDKAGGGAWRVADTATAISSLRTAGRRDVLTTLATRLAFSFTGEGQPRWYRGLGRGGLRFYGRTMRDGARLAYGYVPTDLQRAIGAVEAAADAASWTLRASTGALLVVDNQRVLHDRTEQGEGMRMAALAFVAGRCMPAERQLETTDGGF